MRSEQTVGRALLLAAASPLLYGCAQVAGLEDREVNRGAGGCAPLYPGALPEPTVVADGEDHPRGIALDAQNVYWINEGTAGTAGGAGDVGGAVRRRYKAVGVPLDLALTAPKRPHIIGLHAGELYWVATDSTVCAQNSERDQLFRLPVDDGAGSAAPTNIWTSCGRPEGMAFDGANVYMARPKAGRVQSVSQDDFSRKDVFTDEDTTEDARVTAPWGVAVDEKSVYCTDDSGRVLSYDKGDKSKRTLVDDDPGAEQPMPIAVDDENVYWITNHRLLRHAKVYSPASTGVVLAAQIVEPGGLTVRDGHVYFTDTNAGTVMSVRSDGCDGAVAIATGQSAPTAIAVDDSGVYWTNYGGGQIMKLALPQ
jgi:hypothetical protein